MEVRYWHDTKVHNLSAPREVVPILMNLVNPTSVVDVGCGLGTWLAAFQEQGLIDVVGVDGDYVDRSLLCIGEDKFVTADLTQPFELGRKFDLVVSLEVAEHLPESAANTFVQTLTSLGEVILFSAAVPGQGGQNHLNEQWPEYWQEKFAKYGYQFYDVVREKVWWNEKVEWWYRQNIFLISRNQLLNEYIPSFKPLAQIHPAQLTIKNQAVAKSERLEKLVDHIEQGEYGVANSYSIFKNALLKYFKS